MSAFEITPRRIAAGLAAGAVVGVALLSAWFSATEARLAEGRFERLALLRLRALAEVAERAGATEAARAVVAAWAREERTLTALRFVALEERTLEFSTAEADRAAGEPPRRLVRDEKPLFDLAQQLRTAVETNREEGGSRVEEVAVAPLADRRLSVAVPVEREGGVYGLLQAETAVAAPPAEGALGPLAADVAKIVLPLLLLLWFGFGGGRGARVPAGALAATIALLLAGAFWLASHRATVALLAAERAGETEMGRAALGAGEQAARALAATGAVEAAPFAPSAWDGDRQRRPLGLIGDDGAPVAAALDARAAGAEARGRRALGAAGLAGLALFAFLALGQAARLRRALERHRVAYAYAVPALLGMLVLVFFPFFYGIALSFTNSNIYNSNKPITEIWTGLENYREILGDLKVSKEGEDGRVVDYRNFYWTLGFTIFWTITNVTVGVTVGLALALALNTRGLAGKPIYRVLLILPWAVPNYITALIWKGMFHQQFGVINQVVQMAGFAPIAWFEKPLTSFATVLTTNGWLSFPFMMVISLGALQSIPADQYEAARVDGASRWQQFTHITLPSLKPALVPAIILSVIWTFNMFNIIYLVSQGEPGGATEILITQAYKIAFEQYRYGYAAAYSTVIFLILLAYGTWQNRVTKASEGI